MLNAFNFVSILRTENCNSELIVGRRGRSEEICCNKSQPLEKHHIIPAINTISSSPSIPYLPAINTISSYHLISYLPGFYPRHVLGFFSLGHSVGLLGCLATMARNGTMESGSSEEVHSPGKGWVPSEISMPRLCQRRAYGQHCITSDPMCQAMRWKQTNGGLKQLSPVTLICQYIPIPVLCASQWDYPTGGQLQLVYREISNSSRFVGC